MNEIQCLCGAVRVQLDGEPRAQFFCHCDDCQAVHGAAYVPIAMYAADAVKVTKGEPRAWARRSSPRVTCRDCGTRLFSEVPAMGVRGLTASLLPTGMFNPTFHMQCQFALLPVKDGLPHFKTFPAAFGGSDETVDW
jgi:hypothetical protein